jgi:hypothetical protein
MLVYDHGKSHQWVGRFTAVKHIIQAAMQNGFVFRIMIIFILSIASLERVSS